jgi:predicted Zn-dependent peptidase
MNEPDLQLDELVNGVKILSVNNQHSLSTILYFYLRVGSCNEDETNSGISHFIEHMLFKGTKKYPNKLAISKLLDSLGVDYNAFTAKKLTCYYFKFLSNIDTLNIICQLAHDMLFHSLFRQVDIDKECNVIIEEYNAFQNNPPDLFDDLVDNLYFSQHPLGKSVIGSPTTLKAITRSDLLAYHRKYYTSDNLTIVIGGNLPKEANNTIQTHFGKFSKSLSPLKNLNIIPVFPFTPVFHKISDIVYIPKPMPQNIVSMIFPTNGMYDENRIKFIILKNLLGGNMSSRLFINIRDKLGLVYTINAELNNYVEGGYFSIEFKTDAKNTQRCIDEIVKELNSICKRGFTEAEFTRSVKNIKTGLIMAMENNESMTDYYGNQMFIFPQILSFEYIMTQISSVKLSEINKLSTEFFTNFKTVIYGEY